MFKHLLPLGTPTMLSIFIVIIESIRRIIRPLTLSIRLIANLVAGHLLLSLLRITIEHSVINYLYIFLPLVILILLEFTVALIQGYVFIILISLIKEIVKHIYLASLKTCIFKEIIIIIACNFITVLCSIGTIT